MKYKGRMIALILVLIASSFYITYHFLRDGYFHTIELLGLPIMLLIAWWSGKQYDTVKLFKEKVELKSKELQRTQKLFQTIFENAPIGIALVNKNGIPVISNKKLQDMLGYTEIELSTMSFDNLSHPEDAKLNMKLLNELLEGKTDHYLLEKRYFRKDGQVVWGKVTSSAFPDITDGSTYVIGMVNNITKRKITEQKLQKAYQEMEYLSNQDGLTGIANRRYFDNYLDREYVNSIQYSRPLSLIMVDIDFFKQYNDKYGHLEGDECLKQIASTLEKTINQSKGLVARYGGEEFVIVLPETDKINASVIAKKICAAVEELNIPHIGSNISKYLTVSLGVSTVISDSKSMPENLILEADKALYQAKQKGRNRVEIYSNEMEKTTA